MISSQTLTTALATTATPAGLGMPVCAHLVQSAVSAATTGVDARDRRIVWGAKPESGEGFAVAYIPGTSAWRPPIC